MKAHSRWSTVLLAAAGLGSAGAASAQVRFEAGPVVGVYAPLGSFRPPPFFSTGLPGSPSDLAGPTVGAAARLWAGRHLGVQLEVAAAYSHVGGGATPAGVLPGTSARVCIGTAQLLVNLLGSTGPRRVWLSGGSGLVNHGGEAYGPYQGRTHLAGVLGVGASLPIGAKLSFSAGLTTLLYSMAIRDAMGNKVESGTQFDGQLATGLSWNWR